MSSLSSYPVRAWALTVVLAVTLAACGDDSAFDFPRPSEPFETTLYDLIGGPIDRPSGFDVVAGEGTGVPRTVRIDQSGEWDVAFALLDGEPVWLPRGFFEGVEPSSGILSLSRAFEEITEAPEDRERYETEEPLPISTGRAYVIRSRSDPVFTFPCRIFALLEVTAIEQNPARIHIRFLWNPNCDDRNVTPGS